MRIFLITLVLSLSACGDDGGGTDAAADATPDATPDSATDTGGGSTFAGAYAEDSCAPDDGGAVSVTLYESLTEMCMADQLTRTLRIDVWASITPGMTITSSSDGGVLGEGSATLCLGGTAPCLTSQNFTITFDSFVSGDRAAGTYSITFGGDQIETGSFDAPWCAGDVLCG